MFKKRKTKNKNIPISFIPSFFTWHTVEQIKHRGYELSKKTQRKK